MAAFDADSDRRARRIQDDILRRMTPEDRFRAVCGLIRAADAIACAGIRERFPQASEREVFLRLAVRKLGPDLACRVYPELERIDLRA
jgi:hypothetical protein